MSAAAGRLSPEDEADLWNIGVDFAESVEAVEQIVARHLAAALAEAALAVETHLAAKRSP